MSYCQQCSKTPHEELFKTTTKCQLKRKFMAARCIIEALQLTANETRSRLTARWKKISQKMLTCVVTNLAPSALFG